MSVVAATTAATASDLGSIKGEKEKLLLLLLPLSLHLF